MTRDELLSKPEWSSLFASVGTMRRFMAGDPDSHGMNGLIRSLSGYLDSLLDHLDRRNPVVWYNLGCSYSLVDDMEKSLDALRQALALGYDDFDFMLKDSDLAAVRRMREFKELLDAFRSRTKGGTEAQGTAPSGA